MGLTASENVLLPIGLEIDGRRYREVIIDEMSGIDEENAVSAKNKNNGAKAMTAILRRCVQAIPGLLPQKRNPDSLVDAKYIRQMYIADRDFLFLSIRVLGMDDTFKMEPQCPRENCKDSFEHEMELSDIDVLDWPEEQAAELHVELPRGIPDKEGNWHKKVTWRFPTGIDQERLAAIPRNQITTSTIASCISAVEGLDRRPDTEVVRRMRTRDRMHLMNQVNGLMPGADLRVDMMCPSCDHQWEDTIDLSRFFSVALAEDQKTMPDGRKKRMPNKSD